MADRIKVLLRGDEVEEAPTREMLAHPKKDYTRSLWAVRSHRRPEQPPPKEAPVLSVRAVTAGYGAVKVLHDVSFDLHRGRTVAVVGESGSGKSTTARVIAGLLPPSRGEVRLEGRPLAPSFRARPKEELRAVQLVYQSADTALNPKQRVRDILGRPVEFYAGLTGAALAERIRELLRMIELDPDTFLDRLPGELSGGQKQRVALARALAAGPKVLICDEVTSALDQIVAEGILKLLGRLQNELDLAIMFITHDLATVRAIADGVVVMKEGRVVDEGPKAEIFAPPYHPYTELLLSSVPEMDPDWLDRVLETRAARWA
jgi:peptide/nickel transport system ATP-binding protein